MLWLYRRGSLTSCVGFNRNIAIYRKMAIKFTQKFTIIFLIALIFAAPVPKPDIEEMLLAHTNPLEFANVHTTGLLDMDLLLAAHTSSSPNSMASELNRDVGKLVNGISAVEGGSSSECTSGSCCDSSCSIQKRDVNLQSLFNGPPKNGQLSAAGLAAANRAKNMLQDKVKKHPNNLKLKDGLTQMNDFLAKQKHQVWSKSVNPSTMKFTLVLSALSFVFTAPVANPDTKEILLAHTNAGEFKNVHSIQGLTDKNLFLAAHTPNAPNPPNSLAAQQAAGGAGGAAGGAAGGLGGGLGKILGGLLGKRAVQYEDLFDGPVENGQLNAAGLAAANRAMGMLQSMAAQNPDDADLQQGLTDLQAMLDNQNSQ
ncbi:hypothetical protein HDV04_002575 [Boothiomyces sp. JEL0838]|nr:hypothetical protein HDV04_002575 [Boothiomyces sp. JEL0838]